MGEEQMRVLEMIRDGKITPEEGARLLEALKPAARPAQPPPPPPPPGVGSLAEAVNRIVTNVMEAVGAAGGWAQPLRGLERKREREESGWVDVPVEGNTFRLPRQARLLAESEGGGLHVVQVESEGPEGIAGEPAPDGTARITFDGEGSNWAHYVKRHDDEYVVAVYRTASPARIPRLRLDIPPVADVTASTSGGGVRLEGITSPCTARTSGGGITAERLRGELTAKTSGGGVAVRDCTAPVTLKTSGGSITVEGATAPVVAKTSGGSVRVTGRPPRIDLKTSGGSIHFTGLTEAFNVGTSGGGVTIEGARLTDGQHEARTAAGSVRVLLARDSNVQLDASTTAGRVSVELPGMHSEVRGGFGGSRYAGTYGSGEAQLTLRTSAGSVHVGVLEDSR